AHHPEADPGDAQTGPAEVHVVHSRTLPPGTMSSMHVDELNAAHRTRFRTDRQYEGGEVGAERLLDEDGRAFVLKRQPPGLAPPTTEALRARGYPAPRYVVVAESYSVQEELPGRPLGDWGVPANARLLELNALQEGAAVDDDRSWPATIV